METESTDDVIVAMDTRAQRSQVMNQSNSCHLNTSKINTDQRGDHVTKIPSTNTLCNNVEEKQRHLFNGNEEPSIAEERSNVVNVNTNDYIDKYFNDVSFYGVQFSDQGITNRILTRYWSSLPDTFKTWGNLCNEQASPDEQGENVLKKLRQRRHLFASRKYRTMDSYLSVNKGSRSDLRRNSTMMLFGGQNKGRRDSVIAMQIRQNSATRKTSLENKSPSTHPSLRRASFAVPQFLRCQSNSSDKSNSQNASVDCYVEIDETDDENRDVTKRLFTVNIEIQVTETITDQSSGYVVDLEAIHCALEATLGNSGKTITILHSKNVNSVVVENKYLSAKRKRSTFTPPFAKILDDQGKDSNNTSSLIQSDYSDCPVKVVIATMKTKPRDYTCQLTGCKEMSRLATEETVDALMCKQDGISVIIHAIKRFKDSRELVKTACQTLSKIATNSDASCIQICKVGGISTMFVLLRHYMNEPDVIKLLLDILASVSLVEDSISILLENSGHSEILSTMSRHPDDSHVTKHCCFILGNIVSTVEVAQSVMYIGGVHAIIGAMQRFSGDAKVLETCCRALGCFSAHDEVCMDVSNAGAVNAVLVALTTSETQARLQECGCWALACLTKFCESCEELCKNHGIQTLIKALVRFAKEEAIQEYGSWTLCNVAAHDDLVGFIATDNVLSCLLDTMVVFPANIEIQEHIFFAVSQIVMTCVEMQNQLVKSGGIRKVVDIMTSSPDGQELQEHGCRIIGNIAVREHLRNAVEDGGASRAVISAMLTHDRNEQIQLYGCMALTNLTANVEENKMSVVMNSGVTAVLRTIKEMLDDEQITMCGIKTLANLMETGDACYYFVEEDGIAVMRSLLKRQKKSLDFHIFIASILSSLSSANVLHDDMTEETEQILQQIVNCCQGDAEVQLSLCHFYENLTLSDKGCNMFLRHGCLQKLRDIVARYRDDKDIQTSGCKTMAAIAMRKISLNCLDGSDASMVLNVINRFHEHSDVLTVCCGALSYMAEHNDDLRNIIIQHNGISSVLHSLRQHADDVRVQVVGMMALDSISRTETEEIDNQAEVLEFVTDIMSRQSENIEIEIYGCNVLSAIGKEVPSKSRKTFEPVINILSRKRPNPELQNAAVDALQSLLCGEDEDLLNEMKSKLPFLDDHVWQGCFIALEIK